MNDPKEAVSKVTYAARQKVLEFRRLWMEQYPDSVDQTYYNLVMSQLDIMQTLVRLAAEVEE